MLEVLEFVGAAVLFVWIVFPTMAMAAGWKPRSFRTAVGVLVFWPFVLLAQCWQRTRERARARKDARQWSRGMRRRAQW